MARTRDPSPARSIQEPPLTPDAARGAPRPASQDVSAQRRVKPAKEIGDRPASPQGAVSQLPRALASADHSTGKPPVPQAPRMAAVAEAATSDAALQTVTLDLEHTCAKANRIRDSLAEFANQLADVCDNTEEKVTRLLETLTSGKQARQKLEEASAKAADQVSRLESTISTIALQREELDAAGALRVSSTVQTIRDDAETAVRTHLSELNATADRHVAEVRHSMDAQRSQLDRAARQHNETLKSAMRSQLELLRETTEQSVGRIKGAFDTQDAKLRLHNESLRRFEELSRDHIEHAEALVRKQEQRVTAAATQCITRLQSVFEQSLEKARNELDRVIADQLQAAKEEARKTSESTRNDQRILDRMIGESRKRAEELLRSQETLLATAAEQHVAQLDKTFNAKLAEASERLETEMAAGRRTADEAVRRVAQTAEEAGQLLQVKSGECGKHVEALVDCQETRLTEVAEQCAADLQRALEKKVAAIQNGLDQRLCSKLQAADEAVRRTSQSTQDAEHSRKKLIDERARIEQEVESFVTTSQEIKAATSDYQALGDTIQPATAALSDCLVGSTATIDKIERLIQDVWTLTTTAQQRSGQLSERCGEAVSTAERLEGLRAEAEAQAATLSGHNVAARRRTEKLDRVSGRSEELLGRIEAVYEKTASSAADAERSAEAAVGHHKALTESITSGKEVLQELQRGVCESKETSDELTERKRSAHEIIDQMVADTERYRALSEELEVRFTRGQEIASAVGEAADVGEKIRDDLSDLTGRAGEAARDIAEMLAALTERRELLEGSDDTVREFLACTEQVHIKLQQLQTRADSFQHQLSGMLANPRKIVDDAKTQAGQLETVCNAVQKIFAGLSQASLQANRDITKFARISREANGTLTQISAETERAGQSLREWVDEALHVHARLSKSLAQVPPVRQTHPTSDLDALARTSSAAIPAILRSAHRQDRKRDIVPGQHARQATDDPPATSVASDVTPADPEPRARANP